VAIKRFQREWEKGETASERGGHDATTVGRELLAIRWNVTIILKRGGQIMEILS